MAKIFPLKSDARAARDRGPFVLDIDDEQSDAVFSALSSAMARRILSTLHGEPMAASDLARELDTTVQNVQYHIGKLDEAGLIEVVDTWYSDRGREMKVYAPADSALVLFSGEPSKGLREILLEVLGVGVLLGVMAIVFRWLVLWWADPIRSPTDPVFFSGEEAVTLYLDPGALFMFGGLSAILLLLVWSIWRSR